MERTHATYPDVQTAPEALQWAITAYQQLYHFDDGLNPDEKQERDRRERGQTTGYVVARVVASRLMPAGLKNGRRTIRRTRA